MSKLDANGQGQFATTATVGEKGQIVIPKQARDLFNIRPGDTLVLLVDADRGIAIPPKGAFEHIFNSVFNNQNEQKDDDK